MSKRIAIAGALFIFLTTVTVKKEIEIFYFNLKEISVENNFLISTQEIQNLLSPIYEKNLILLSRKEIEKELMKNSLIESYKIKKKYPNSLNIKIFEKKPIAILQDKKNKFFLSEKIELIEFKNFQYYQNLPYVFGNKDNFKIFYENLRKINFPFKLIKKYTYYESNRWDLETSNKKIIKLPSKNYIKSLKNYLEIREKSNFKSYFLFDYRIDNQLILK